MTLRLSLLTVFGFIMTMSLMFVGAQSADAVDYYWAGATADWGTATNWSTGTAACAGGAGGVVPGVGDKAIFDGSCIADVDVTASTNITILETQAGYTGTITQLGSFDVDGDLTIVLNAILDANGNALTVGGNWTNGGNFDLAGAPSTVTFDGAGTQTVISGTTAGSFEFGNVVIANGGGSVELSTDSMKINGNLTIDSGAQLSTLSNGLIVSGTYANNSGALEMNGNEAVTLTMDTDSGQTLFVDSVGAGSYNLNGFTAFYDLVFNDLASGGDWTMAANTDVNGMLYIVDGTFATAGFDLNVAGIWRNDSTFTHSNGHVILDGSSQTVRGSTTFYDLTKSVSSADTLTLNASDTFTVANDLILNGAAGNLLTVASSTPATAANLDSNGTFTVSYVSVSDNVSAGSALPICAVGCINGGGNTGWTFATTGGTSPALFTDTVLTANITSPNGGEALVGGSTADITWTASGDDVDSVSLYYSANNGQTYSLIAADEENDGTYSWTVPNMDITNAKVKVAAVTSAGSTLLTGDSNQSFSITLNPDLVEEIVDEVVDEQDSATVAVMLDVNGVEVNLVEGSLFRGVELSGVYFVKDGTRYVFPNTATFDSYGYSFDDVVMVQDDQLRKLKIGGRMIMAEGTMIKIQSDAKTYQVQANGVLAHVPDETTATSLYGPTWNQQITDISVVFWFDYTVGDALASQQ
ncbi:hypothetical protein HQ524_01855 [Candidatus Uhrbacteria bacterium]|nr:hypothetical protein [Candidatus Uhrbacteria bacterium]